MKLLTAEIPTSTSSFFAFITTDLFKVLHYSGWNSAAALAFSSPSPVTSLALLSE